MTDTTKRLEQARNRIHELVQLGYAAGGQHIAPPRPLEVAEAIAELEVALSRWLADQRAELPRALFTEVEKGAPLVHPLVAMIEPGPLLPELNQEELKADEEARVAAHLRREAHAANPMLCGPECGCQPQGG